MPHHRFATRFAGSSLVSILAAVVLGVSAVALGLWAGPVGVAPGPVLLA